MAGPRTCYNIKEALEAPTNSSNTSVLIFVIFGTSTLAPIETSALA